MTIKAVLSRAEATAVAVELIRESVSFLQAEKVALVVLRECAKWTTFDWMKVKDFVDRQYSKQVYEERRRFRKELEGDVGEAT